MAMGDGLDALGGNGTGMGTASEEMSDIRMALGTRQRLRAATTKELCAGGERVAWLREEVHRAEGDLRAWERLLQARAGELAQTAARMEAIGASAERACEQLSTLARENDTLTRELASLEEAAVRLERSVGRGEEMGEVALDSFAASASALARELTRVMEDQGAIRDRMRHLMEEAEMVGERARSLRRCMEMSVRQMTDLGAEVAQVLGASKTAAAPARPPVASEATAGAAATGLPMRS